METKQLRGEVGRCHAGTVSVGVGRTDQLPLALHASQPALKGFRSQTDLEWKKSDLTPEFVKESISGANVPPGTLGTL
jgi:hypothetical protein